MKREEIKDQFIMVFACTKKLQRINEAKKQKKGTEIETKVSLKTREEIKNKRK